MEKGMYKGDKEKLIKEGFSRTMNKLHAAFLYLKENITGDCKKYLEEFSKNYLYFD